MSTAYYFLNADRTFQQRDPGSFDPLIPLRRQGIFAIEIPVNQEIESITYSPVTDLAIPTFKSKTKGSKKEKAVEPSIGTGDSGLQTGSATDKKTSVPVNRDQLSDIGQD